MDEKIMKDAQYRKGLSIAFFNATNGAVEIIKLEGLKTPAKKGTKKVRAVSLETRLKNWRNWLLEEHKEYYANVIAQVGVNYKAEDSIAKLKSAKTLEDLKVAWVLLSADERKDGEIRKVAQELQTKFKNEKA